MLVLQYPVSDDAPKLHPQAQRYSWKDGIAETLGGPPTEEAIASFKDPPDAAAIEAFFAPAPPSSWTVSTYTIVRRLEEAGLIDTADTALSQNKTLLRRFYTVGRITNDAEDAIGFIKSIGGDPTSILAPE